MIKAADKDIMETVLVKPLYKARMKMAKIYCDAMLFKRAEQNISKVEEAVEKQFGRRSP